MAAKVFQVIGVVFIILFTLVFVVALPFLSKFLKKLNRSLGDRGRVVRDQMRSTLTNIETAQDEIRSVSAMTEAVRGTMDSAIKTADGAVAFLKSSAFQVGVPLAVWTLFLLIAVPRGIRWRRLKKKRTGPKPIPPPSWTDEDDEM